MNHSEVTRYPLAWPFGRPRTDPSDRAWGKFSTRQRRGNREYPTTEGVTLAQAVSRLQEQLDIWRGATDIVLSTNVELRLDGQPRGGQKAPADPGACLYFKLDGKPHALPCDRYTSVEQNIAAIAAHIEATRAIERYGVADMRQMYAGFEALPSPEQASVPHWRTVLECSDATTIAEVKRAYQRRASAAHPDKHPNRQEEAAVEFSLVQRAWLIAQQEIRS